MAKRQLLGRVYGMKTNRGIALLQIVTVGTQGDLHLMRVCDGFLQDGYTKEDIENIINRKELFFMPSSLGFTKRHSLYKEFFVFDEVFDVPETVEYPTHLRSWFPITRWFKGEIVECKIHWFYREVNNYYWTWVKPEEVTEEFLNLSPAGSWSFPHLQWFLENDKHISDWYAEDKNDPILCGPKRS